MQVLVIDDHEIVWSGLRAMLERLARRLEPPAELAFHACRDLSALDGHAARPFTLILLDYHLPGVTGPDALARVRATFEGVPVVVISGDPTPRRVREVIECGAAGFIPKTMSDAEMQAALMLVLARGVYLPALALLDADPPANAADEVLAPESVEQFLEVELSPRQRQVLALALRGVPNKLIARQIGIAEGTVKLHLAMVYRALGVRNRTEAMYRVLSADAAKAIERL